MKFVKLFLSVLLIPLFFWNCGGSGGTETGSTDSGTTIATLPDRLEGVVSTLVLSVNQSEIESSISPSALRASVDGTGDEWNVYLDSDNSYILTDVFGSPDETPAVVTKVRVLLEQSANDLTGLVATDPDFDCTGSTVLSEGDTLDIAFYGTISNGTSEDRYFDCVNTDDDRTIIYGQDASGMIRVVTMSDVTGENLEEPETRGDEFRLLQVVSLTYGEQTESEITVAYLDLQYTQSSNYNGVDNTFGNTDDMFFKSRSRITGRVELDSDGNPTLGTGDFIVTKYDKGVNLDLSTYTAITQTMGRGSYGAEEYSLFKVESDATEEVSTLNRTFCIQMPSDGSAVPANADASNCTALETDFAWGATTFPFDLTPAVDATFDDNLFFEEDDLISDTADNFEIPTY